FDRSTIEAQYVAPRSETEQELARIWSSVLGVARIGIHDNFFTELGGHSLTATQLISRVRTAFEVELPIRCLFEGPTIARLAAVIAECRQNDTQPTAPRIDRTVLAGDELNVDVASLSDAEVDALLAKLLDSEIRQ